MQTGIRELRNNLSRYIRRSARGERIVITSHGRAVAELVPAAAQMSPIDKLIAAGAIRPAIEKGNPVEHWPDIRLPKGTAKALIDADRDER